MDDFDPKEHFDRAKAESYDSVIRRVIPGYETLHRMTRLLLEGELPEAARLLVVGAGTGEEVVSLGSHERDWTFTGVDPSDDMLAVARGRIYEAGLAGHARLVRGTVADLAVDETFHAATLILVLQFLPDDGAKLALLRDINARLEPGAPLVLVDLHGDRNEAHFQCLMEAWRRWQLDAWIPADEVEQTMEHVAQGVHFVPEQRILDLLEEAGFQGAASFFGTFLFGGWIAWKG